MTALYCYFFFFLYNRNTTVKVFLWPNPQYLTFPSHKIASLLIASQALLICSRTEVSLFLLPPVYQEDISSSRSNMTQFHSIRAASITQCITYPITLLGCHQFTQICLFSKILPEDYFSVKKPRKPKISISTHTHKPPTKKKQTKKPSTLQILLKKKALLE